MDKILDLIEKYTYKYSEIPRNPDFPKFEEWEKMSGVKDIKRKLELFYNRYLNFITTPPLTFFGNNDYLWKENEIVVEKGSNILGYLNIGDLIPNQYWSHNFGWIIMSDLIKEVWENSLLDHLRDMGNTGGYYLGQTHFDVLSNYLSNQGETILINTSGCTWKNFSPVMYRRGKIVGFELYFNSSKSFPECSTFKFLETSTGKIRKLSIQQYNVAFSEDHLKIIVKRLKEDMMGIIKSQIDRVEKDIESLDLRKSYLIEELDKLYEKAAYGEEILEDKFGM